MLRTVDVQFGEFLPDAPDFRNPGCVVARNVVAIAGGGYGPLRNLGTVSGAATKACRGASLYERSTGDVITVGGAVDRLWVDVSGTVTETMVTDIGDAYWQFQRFGSRILAVSQNNDLYELSDLDTDTVWTVVTDAPTQAQAIGEVGSRIVVGNLSNNPYAIEWSALNNPITWTATSTNYNGSAELDQTYGKITAIAGDRYPAVYQEYAVSRITRVGPPTVFQIDRIEEARGCIAPNSIAVVGRLTFFLSQDGFAVMDGGSVQLIGASRVNRYFLDSVSDADRHRTHAAIDWANEAVVWSYYPVGSTGFTGQIIYSWAQNRWSTASIEVDWLVPTAVAGTTLEGLDATYPDLDAMGVSLDSPIFQAGNRRLSAYAPVDADVIMLSGTTPVILDSGGTAVILNPDVTLSVLYALDGTTLEAAFKTGEFQLAPGKRTFVNRIYPIVENSAENTTATVTTRNIKGGTLTVSDRGTVNDAGFCPVRGDGRYAAAEITIPAGASWEKAQGVQVSGRDSGSR